MAGVAVWVAALLVALAAAAYLLRLRYLRWRAVRVTISCRCDAPTMPAGFSVDDDGDDDGAFGDGHSDALMAPWPSARRRSARLDGTAPALSPVKRSAGSDASALDADVIIVGGGPVGMTTACLLGVRQLRVLVLEQDVEICTFPRAGALHGDVMRAFQTAGCADELLCNMHEQDVVFVDGDGAPILTVRPGRSLEGHGKILFHYQPELERVLRARAAALPTVRLLLGCEVLQVAPDGRVRVRTEPAAERSLRARFVLGCDGGRSLVRRQLGVRMAGSSFAQRWFVLDIERDATGPDASPAAAHASPGRTAPAAPVYPAPHPALLRAHTFGVGGRRPYVAVRLPLQHQRLEFMVDTDDAEAVLRSPETGTLVAEWLRAVQGRPLRRAVYQYHALTAERWRVGSALLLGDAAHLSPPFAGQGLSSGVRDAANLSWKLALVLRGLAAPHLLCSYEAERRPDVEHAIRLAVFLGGRIQSRHRLVSALVRVFFRAVGALRLGQRLAEGLKDSVPLCDGLVWGVSPLRRLLTSRSWLAPLWPLLSVVGQRVPQPDVWVRDGAAGEPVRWRLDDVLGPGFALLALDCEPRQYLPRSLLLFLAALGTRVVRLSLSAAPTAAPQPGACSVRGRPSSIPFCVAQETNHRAPLVYGTVARAGQVLVVRPDRVVFAVAAADAVAEPIAALQQMLT